MEEAHSQKKRSGRNKDPIWDYTTVHADKSVVCNVCDSVIHRYGVAKVERVRAHFERRCQQSKRPRTDVTEVLTTASPNSSKPNYSNKGGLFKRKFARWLYATGQSFDVAGSDFLLRALQSLRYNAELPTQHELETELLDLEFAASLTRVAKALHDKLSCLTVERWADSDGKTVTSFGVVCDKTSYFLESTTGSRGQESEVTADELETVLVRYKKCVLHGVVTPTTKVLSKSTRDRITKKYPQCVFFYGCVCTALRLLMDDVSTALPWLKKMLTSASELASVFRGSRKLQSLLPSNIAMEFPDTSSKCALLEALLSREKDLFTIVARRDFVGANTPEEQEKLRRVQDFVLGETFVQDVMNSLAILRPLQLQLSDVQSDRTPLSQVLPRFVDLLTEYSSIEWMSKKEKALVTSCVGERFDAVYGVSHGVAYLLDPLYLGQALDAAKRQEVEDFIVNYSARNDVDILGQLTSYKDLVAGLQVNNQAYWQLVSSGAVQPFEFWVERQEFPQLQALALTVFGLPVSSTSQSTPFSVPVSRVKKQFGLKLAPEQLQKLTHVHCNSKADDESSVMTP